VILCFIELSVAAKHQEGKEDQFAISSQYVLAYDYKKFTGDTSAELFESFTKRNALFNAYPFLRESITNLSVKMTLPPVIAPLLRFDNKGDVKVSDDQLEKSQMPSEPKRAKAKTKAKRKA
jgi:preprotein translocase subunit SecB